MNRNNNQSIASHNEKVFLSHYELTESIKNEYIPIAMTTTILAPINRIKICLQTMHMMSINQNEKVFKPRNLTRKLIKEQGFLSLWRGNTANLYKLLTQTFGNIMINTKINNRLKKFTNEKKNFLTRLISSSISSSICLIFSYPFELAHTRMSADMTRYGHKKLNSSVLELFSKLIVEEEGKIIINKRIIIINIHLAISKSNFSNFGIFKLYKGMSLALLSNVLYWTITLSFYERINNYFENQKIKHSDDFEYLRFIKKIFILFGATTLTSIFTSTFIYPLDTFKRHIQVNSSLGFKSEYYSLTKGFKQFYGQGMLHMYR